MTLYVKSTFQSRFDNYRIRTVITYGCPLLLLRDPMLAWCIYGPVSVSLCVHHKLEYYQNG